MHDAAPKKVQNEIRTAFNEAYSVARKLKIPSATDREAMASFATTLRQAWSRVGNVAKFGVTTDPAKRKAQPSRKALSTKAAGVTPSAVVQANEAGDDESPIVQSNAPLSASGKEAKAHRTLDNYLSNALSALAAFKLEPIPAKQVKVAIMAFDTLAILSGLTLDEIDRAVKKVALAASDNVVEEFNH
jgi:hypothetical protein